ncbi:MAG TPA: hypothetical protein VG895_02400 [Patescibacteria group bacterium]|nr:hypothetical protein [Patescibacteria group bacterium]
MSSCEKFCLEIDDLYQPFDWKGNNIDVMCLCHHGIGRSWGMSDYLTSKGIPSSFLEGGLQIVGKQEDGMRRKVLDNLSFAPEILVLLDQYEISIFHSLLSKLDSKRYKPVKYADFETSTDDVLSYFR